METYIIEGTFADVQRRLSELPLNPEMPLRLIITEPGSPDTPEATLFASASRRNGIILIPTKEAATSVTVEQVKQLMEE
jgi:hypothetical protein